MGIVVSIGCGGSTEPPRRESWVADNLTPNRYTMYLAFASDAPTFTGTGSLQALLVPGGAEALTLTGSRRADTLDLLITRAGGGQLRFLGWYVAQGAGLGGHLDGGEFAHVGAVFRRGP
jgi:hypothetical protein